VRPQATAMTALDDVRVANLKEGAIQKSTQKRVMTK
jgi:hypothetical protein